jgi:hypothetical protein
MAYLPSLPGNAVLLDVSALTPTPPGLDGADGEPRR